MTDDQSITEDRVELGELDEALNQCDYPMTTEELTDGHGNHTLQSQGGVKSLEGIFVQAENETYASAREAQNHILNLLNRK